MFVIVYLNDARVLGPFPSEQDAERWYRATPNVLFEDREEVEHAECNADVYVTRLEPVGPTVRPPASVTSNPTIDLNLLETMFARALLGTGGTGALVK